MWKKNEAKYLAIHFLFFAFHKRFHTFRDKCIAGLVITMISMKSFRFFYHFAKVFQKLIYSFHSIYVSQISNNKKYERSPKFTPNDFFKFENCAYIIHIKFSHFTKFLTVPRHQKKYFAKKRSISITYRVHFNFHQISLITRNPRSKKKLISTSPASFSVIFKKFRVISLIFQKNYSNIFSEINL